MSSGSGAWDQHFIDHHINTRTGLSNYKLGMLIFIASEIMFFGGLIGAYIVLRYGNMPWAPPNNIEIPLALVAINTVILLSSSWFMHAAEVGLQNGNQSKFKTNLLITIVLGAIFLSIQGYEYVHLLGEGMGMDSSMFGATFYLLTGFHGVHVFGGLVYLIYIYGSSFSEKHTQKWHPHVEMGSAYWHFVDAVWVFVFTLVYII